MFIYIYTLRRHVCISILNWLPIAAEDMLEKADYFKDGRVNKNALVTFIRDIKKNTKLSDEDAAVIAASKVCSR